MTIADVCNEYPNIEFGYTQTNIPLLPYLPETHRWADEVEADYWWHIRGAANVLRGDDQHGSRTSIAVPRN